MSGTELLKSQRSSWPPSPFSRRFIRVTLFCRPCKLCEPSSSLGSNGLYILVRCGTVFYVSNQCVEVPRLEGHRGKSIPCFFGRGYGIGAHIRPLCIVRSPENDSNQYCIVKIAVIPMTMFLKCSPYLDEDHCSSRDTVVATVFLCSTVEDPTMFLLNPISKASFDPTGGSSCTWHLSQIWLAFASHHLPRWQMVSKTID